MALKAALRKAINQNITNCSVVKIWAIDKSTTLHEEADNLETWTFQVTVRKHKQPKKIPTAR